jgi:hypothetical protein
MILARSTTFYVTLTAEVNMEMEATFANTSVVRTLGLCLMAFHSPVRGQEWRNSVRPDIPIWKTSFDHTRSHIPEDEFRQTSQLRQHRPRISKPRFWFDL